MLICCLKQGCTNFPKIWEPPENFRCQITESQTWSMFHTEDTQLFWATVQNVVTRMTWHLGFLQCWPKYLSGKC
jgi:hypothetical protein